jgi:hypothetical protein
MVEDEVRFRVFHVNTDDLLSDLYERDFRHNQDEELFMLLDHAHRHRVRRQEMRHSIARTFQKLNEQSDRACLVPTSHVKSLLIFQKLRRQYFQPPIPPEIVDIIHSFNEAQLKPATVFENSMPRTDEYHMTYQYPRIQHDYFEWQHLRRNINTGDHPTLVVW